MTPPRQPSAPITYLALVAGFVLAFSALVLTHATFTDGDYLAAHLEGVGCAIAWLVILTLSWSRLHPMMRTFGLFLAAVAGWSLFVGSRHLLQRVLR